MAAWSFCILSIFSLLVCSLAQYGYGPRNDGCTNPSGQEGRCISIQSCPALLSILRQQPLPPESVQFLRNSQCGFEGRIPKVCCPSSQAPVVPIPTTTKEPDNRPVWGGGGANEIPKPEKQTSNWESNPKARLLPLDECGIDFNSRIWNGNITELDEYPWMAIFEYQSGTGAKRSLCAGALISKRYVVTAAHCLSRRELRGFTLLTIRLGEYNTETNPDCDVSLFSGDDDCAPPTQDLGFERIIVHPQYDPTSNNKFHDIGLIRLNKDVQFSEFVKPICLPFDDTAKERYLGEDLIVTGWGKTEQLKQSNLKMKVRLPVVDNEKCGQVYEEKRRQISDGQLCAGGEKGKDSCTGDSGGPLMSGGISSRDGKARYYVAGIVSYGPDPCGKENWPGVYTRVSQYTDWILNQLTE